MDKITIPTLMKLLAIRMVASSVFGFSRSFKILFETELFSLANVSFWVLDILNKATSDPERSAERAINKNITNKMHPVCNVNGKKIELLFVIKR